MMKRPRKKKLFAAVALAVFSVLACEIVSFAVLTFVDMRHGESFESALRARQRELTLAWEPATLFGSFDPLLLVRHEPGGKYGHLHINDEGFIGNGHDDPTLNMFPGKPQNVFRIVLLGGSSAAGTGVQKNDQTIAAQLERALNRNQPSERRPIFQVLNFGAAGGHTGPEFLRFVTHLVYAEPDMVISLDGYNDAAGAVYLPLRHSLEHGVINWGDPHYNYFELLNGHDVSEFTKPRRLLTFTFILAQKGVKKVTVAQEAKQRLSRRLPLYRFSERLRTTHPFYENVLYTNLDAFRSPSRASG